ncbi:MAG: protein kinase, partial [Gemmatimonas sp.]|nr:protein kinase [Gemmatimonas sp.]
RSAAELAAPLLASVPRAPPLRGATVSHYEIIEKLGSGGMGVVYQARDLRLGRLVALKFLPPHLSMDTRAKERLLLEAQAAAALDHPHICTIHEIGETAEGQLFLAMPFYEGETLKQCIARGPLPLQDAANVVIQAARGLAAAHERGIIHRDIKPANLLVSAERVVKILDFGIAKLTDVSLTGPNARPGTVAYMSPEQARGDAVDHRTDLWSLGVVLYEMLTGQRPFRGDHESAVLHAILHATPEPAAALRTEVFPALAQVLDRALAKDPTATPQVGHQAGPVEMHVDPECGRRGKVGEPALLSADLRQGVAAPAQLLGHGDREVVGVAQRLEVLVEKAVLAVVGGRASGATGQ